MKLPKFAIATSLLLLAVTSCSLAPSSETTSPQAVQTEIVEESSSPEAPPVDDSFSEAVHFAMSAAEAAQTAQTTDEWENVAFFWSKAIESMKAVPESSENYQTAQQKAEEYQQNLEYAQQNAQVSSEPTVSNTSKPEQIAIASGGLGDTRPNFDKKYGTGRDEAKVHVRYQNDYLLVTFVKGENFDFADGRAQNIMIQFEATQTPLVSTQQAIQTAEQFLPKDAVKEKEQQSDDDFYHIQYTSQSLAKAIGSGWFFDSSPGVFTVSLWQDWDDPSKVYAVSIMTGGI
jgi:hypothetical protein